MFMFNDIFSNYSKSVGLILGICKSKKNHNGRVLILCDRYLKSYIGSNELPDRGIKVLFFRYSKLR